MPILLNKNLNYFSDSLMNQNVDHQYKYPKGLNLKPGSKLHSALVDLIFEKASLAAGQISTRFADWNTLDQSLTGYIPADEEEQNIKAEDSRKPVAVVFPYSYAILETLLSYMMAAFFRDPIFRYEGVGPEDVIGSILMEKIIQLHCNKSKVMLNLHTMFRDSFVYGSGKVSPIWRFDKAFSGNALLNIDPYRSLPDVNVAADKIQDSEYDGWTSDTNYMSLLEEEFENIDMFNVKYLSNLSFQGTNIYQTDNSGRYTKTGMTKNLGATNNLATEIHMYIKIIPRDYHLSDNDRPELWYFRLVGDAVIITARPAGFNHGKFPTTAAVPDFDGYSSAPIGRLEILNPMQGVLDWLFNSHIANVRKAVNDTLIYDPSLINSKDLRDPKPGGLIRMRRQAWGQGRVSDAVHQLQINDVTRGNVSDSGWIINSMQTLMGTDDAAMGALRQGGPERLTKAEFQGTASGAVNRLERVARITGLQAMQDIGEFFASHTQQVMDDAQYIKVLGDWQDVLLQEYGHEISRGRLSVSPDDLDINYDVIVRDGSVPGGNYAEVWVRLFDILSKQPELAQQFDMVRIFKHIARSSGAKNVNDFARKGGAIEPNIMPDAQVQQQAQAGNIVPIQQRQ